MSPYHLVVHAVLDSALARLAHHGLEGELAAYVDRSEVVVDLVPLRIEEGGIVGRVPSGCREGAMADPVLATLLRWGHVTCAAMDSR